MPVIQFVYIWSRISAVVALSVMGLKGLIAPKVQIAEVPLDAGFGWEKSWWLDDDTAVPDMPDPIQTQIDKCDRISDMAPAAKARFFCKVQKVKLQGLKHVHYIIRKSYSIASTVLPTFGCGGYFMLAEFLLMSGIFFMTMKTQLCCLKLLMEKVHAVYKSVTRGVDPEQVEREEDDGVVGQRDNNVDQLGQGIAHEADRLGGEDLSFQNSSGGRRFHGELAFQEGFNEEVGASSEGMGGAEADGRMKKEVRFSDDSFDDHGKGGARGSQRGVSSVKRLVPEPISKNCGAKMTRSVPAAGTTGAGSRSSWNL